MSVDDAEDSAPMMSVDVEIRELIGLFDLPAFARRGQDVEFAVGRIHARCREHREELFEMVRLRLRQWARVACGPGDWKAAFSGPVGALWELAGAGEPSWGAAHPRPREQRTVARDLVASLGRFNRRWLQFLDSLNLDPANRIIDQYNKYYVLEKECVMGSARLAARHFNPLPLFSRESLLREYPLLPVPELA
jgi:hypothetical protein